jgi:hypothetical protein
MKKNSILLLLLFAAKLGMGQALATTNTGVLYISSSSDILYAGSDFTNNSSSALTNNGQLYIKGNLANNQSSMAVGTGTLYLNGASAQNVSGAQPFKTYHLNTNNSAGITLNNNLSVSGVHTFVNGVITTSATPNYLIYEAGSSYTGDADSRHVHGWVKKFGTTNFTFPVGTGTIERAAGITNLSASSEINATYRQPTNNIYNLQGPLVQVQDKEYWQIDRISGGTAQIALNWDNSKVAFPPTVVADVRVAYYNSSLWTSVGGTGTGNMYTTGSVTSNAVNAFGPFTFGFVSIPLPLDFINFTADRKDNYTRLNWTTAHEQNTDHFIVERSNDAVQFYDVTQVASRKSVNNESYSSNDYTAIGNVAYYRIRSVDIDGKEKLSAIISVKATNTGNLLTLVANPVHDQAVLAASSELNGMFDYRVYSINGKLMQEGNLVIQNGGQYTLLLKGSFDPGTYTLEVTNKLESFRYKLVVQ